MIQADFFSSAKYVSTKHEYKNTIKKYPKIHLIYSCQG